MLLDGIAELLRESGLAGWEDAFAAFRAQTEAYAEFVERELLPRARSDHKLPAEVYAFALHQVGVDIPPADLARQAHEAFDAIVAEMQALAPRVAAAKGFPATADYRDVVRRAQARADHRRRR